MGHWRMMLATWYLAAVTTTGYVPRLQTKPPQYYITTFNSLTKPSQHNLQIPTNNLLTNITHPTLPIPSIIKHHKLDMHKL